LKKIAIVDIKGGFGNQIFQFAFANEIKKLGYKVYINKSFYDFKNKITKDSTYRELILHENNFNFQKAGNAILVFFKVLTKLNLSNKTKWFFKYFDKVFIKYDDYNFDSSKLNHKFVYLDGYWQNIEYLNNNLDFIKQSISNDIKIKKSLNSPINKNETLLIVRRGDYIDMKEDLDITFYKEALNYFEKLDLEVNLNIFTDDVDWVNKNKLFDIAKNVYGPEDSSEGVIDLFSKMITNEHYIICNSTFALIAAILAEKKSSHVLIADPWMRNYKNEKLFKSNWIKIKNTRPKY